jgi:hypothetical protein
MPVTPNPDKPLIEKLGFAPGDTVFVETTPDWYSDFADTNGFDVSPDISATHAHLFISSKSDLISFLNDYDINDVEKSVWFSWPKKSAKKSSGIKSDVTEQTFRDHVLPLGWVDTKVAAIDDTWSGLKFQRRKT